MSLLIQPNQRWLWKEPPKGALLRASKAEFRRHSFVTIGFMMELKCDSSSSKRKSVMGQNCDIWPVPCSAPEKLWLREDGFKTCCSKSSSRMPGFEGVTLFKWCQKKQKHSLIHSAFKKLRSWDPIPSLYGKQKGEKWKQWHVLFSWAPKSLQMVIAAMKLKDVCFLKAKLWQA